MQTLKTGAIIVLLATIVFSAYTSITAPPESSLGEYDDALVIDDGSQDPNGFGSLPPSLAMDFDIGTAADAPPPAPELGTPMANINPGQDSTTSTAVPVAPIVGVRSSDPAYGGNDQPKVAEGNPSPTAGNQFVISDRNRKLGSAAPVDLASANLSNQYPNTGATYAIPDPATAIASLGGSELAPGSSSAGNNAPNFGGNRAESRAPSSGRAKPALGLQNAIATADRQYREDRRKDALATLSVFYGTPNLDAEQKQQLYDRLDFLAVDVIYSKEHLLVSPYRVNPSETMMEIAEKFNVSWELLSAINGIKDPLAILPGTELKVIPGPIRAEIDLSDQELTVFVGDLYAGRFPIAIGTDPPPTVGEFTVQDKQPGKTYYNRSGAAIPAGSPQNPYGNTWIDLGGQLCIHGSPDAIRPSANGCISLSGDLANDLSGMLTVNSTVTIKP